jgi:hypothetical protein
VGRGEIVKADHRIASKNSIAKQFWIVANPVEPKTAVFRCWNWRAG